MSDFELIIVGGGLASARAIRAYREAGGDGTIALVSADSTIPYHRPPLSKRYLRGEAEQADTLVEPHAFYNGNGIELLLETEVASIDPGKHTITTRDGHDYRSRKLLLATGAVPRQLDVDGAELPGVFTLRSLSDSTAIREAAAETRDAVVVGSGFIGMEVAASLSELELDVTLVSRDVDLFSQLGSPEISERLVTLYGERGVDVLRGDEVPPSGATRGSIPSSCIPARRSAPALPSSASASSLPSRSSKAGDRRRQRDRRRREV